MAKPDNWSQMTPDEKRAHRLEVFSKSYENIEFVSPKAEENYKTRLKRLVDVYSMKIPDRVPLNVNAGNVPLAQAGVDVGDAFYNPEKALEAARVFNEKYSEELECYSLPFASSGKALDILDYKLYAWPGHKLPMSAPGWQFIEGEYMTADEYDDLITDPSDFWMRKYLPRVFGAFEPLGLFQAFTNISENVHIQYLMPLAAEPVQNMLRKLLEAGDAFKAAGSSMGRLRGGNSGAAHGFPITYGGFAKAPFDTLGDTLRGTTNIMKDMYRCPDKLLKALDVIADISIKNALNSPNIDNTLIFTYPLHKGADGWMSQKQFDKFYWPSLKKLLDALINEGLVQSLFAEGGYNSRLHCVNQFPKGSVAWMFDRTDMAEAKKALGNDCVIIGNVPSSMMVTSDPKDVKEYCRNLIETCKPGGGYILSPGSSTENPKLDNIRAMVEAVNEYGWYK